MKTTLLIEKFVFISYYCHIGVLIMNVVSMKKLSEVEEKLFTSSLNICPEACRKMGGVGRKKLKPPSPYPHPTLFQLIR
jgi:hypothetical protein